MRMAEAPEVFPWCLARVSGQSPLRLDALRLPRTVAALTAALAAEAAMAELAPALADALHRLVPDLADRPLRQTALALKRAVHNQRAPGIATGVIPALAARLDPTAAGHLVQWQCLADQRDRWLTAARLAFTAEADAADRALVAAMDDPDLQRGLALASPDFLNMLLHHRETTARPGTRFARSCLSYLARAAVKTSPLSTFTQIGLAPLVGPGAAPPAAPARPVAVSYPVRALATAWLSACARDPQLAPALHYRANPSLRGAGTARTMLIPEYQCLHGFFWRQDRQVSVGAYAHLVEIVRDLGEAGYRDCLLRIGTIDDAHAAFVRLLNTGLLRPVAPWARADRQPLRRLATALQALGGAYPLAVAELLTEIAGQAEAVANTPAGQRPALLHDLRTRCTAGLTRLSPPPPAWLSEAPLVYEDVGFPGDLAALGEHVRRDLQALGAEMRGYLLRTHLYDYLTGHFTAQFGAGGVCTDVLGFLGSFLARPDAVTLIRRSLEQDRAALAHPGHPHTRKPAGQSSAPPTATVFFQIDAAGPEALRQGDYRLVLNQCNPGHGGLFLRFQPVLAANPAATDAVYDWLVTSHPGAQVLDFPFGTEWTSLQHQGLGRFPSLEWPTEWPATAAPASLNLSDLTLIHDPATDTLVLADRGGRPVAPRYLGVIPHHLTTGPLRLFFTLLDPWVNGFPGGSGPHFMTAAAPAPDRVEFSPRAGSGRLVWQRATWRVPPEQFPVPAPGEADHAFFFRARRWAREHGLPPEVFVRAERRTPSFDPNRRKPVWICFDSLHSLLAVKPLLGEDVVALRLEEALPGRAGHWLPGPDGQPRACEFLALLRWSASAP